MEKILVVGANTRPVACSAKKIGYEVYATDYFCTDDLKKCSETLKCVLSQKPYESCGKFADNFDATQLEDLSREFIDKIDLILCSSGISPERFPKSKIIGNKETQDVDNKYKLYKKLKNKFNVPETFLISDFKEASEIVYSFNDKKFIIKPIFGSGGIGIKKFEDISPQSRLDGMMLQELVEGKNISSSVLSTGTEAKTIITSSQIIGEREFGQLEPFGYCGNIVPYFNDDNKIRKTAEEVIEDLSLIGSNGVDMVHDGDDIYVVEVNPRFQGTFECAEMILGINMVDAHLKACEGILIETEAPEKFGVKMIVFAKERSIVGDLNAEGVYDIPQKNVIIERGEPVATVIISNNTLENVLNSAKKNVENVYKSIKTFTR
ncbi:MAG: ATP-grasp domain-containing protein [Euryarchaeota archaeon]|nr:ATP-grasp domain-containing protein [Euryarchaeota archaeon]